MRPSICCKRTEREPIHRLIDSETKYDAAMNCGHRQATANLFLVRNLMLLCGAIPATTYAGLERTA